MTEPSITINGVQLTPGQAMTVRVAIEMFAMQIAEPDFEIGPIGSLYQASIAEIRKVMYR